MIPKLGQNLLEFGQLLRIYKELSPSKVLEIGTHEGGSFYYWLKYAPPKSTVVSIDIQRIGAERYESWAGEEVEIAYYSGDSTSVGAIDFAKRLAPFDFIFIDGDHSYDGVKSDWLNYSPLGNNVVAFHDIAKTEPYIGDDGKIFPIEVYKLWQEFKSDSYFSLEEIIEPHPEWGSGPGIGVVYL